MNWIKQKLITLLTLSVFSILTSTSVHSTEVDDILTQKEKPVGIVFEIVSGDDGLLQELLPTLNEDIKRLREKYPALPIAIVSHGKEQFDLTIKNQATEQQTHSLVQQLVKTDVDVHVCGTHASWYGVQPEDFPDYVDVTPAGPTQINDYEEMGYDLIVLTE